MTPIFLAYLAIASFAFISPVQGQSCFCWSSLDCINNRFCPNTCARDWLRGVNRCMDQSLRLPPLRPTQAPVTPVKSPTGAPVGPPTRAPVPPTRAPTPPTRAPTPPTRAPVRPATAPTSAPVPGGELQSIPDTCQVDTLLGLMDSAIVINKAIGPQWLRLAFHDAGTFNMQVPEGGANGCLLTNDTMREAPENTRLDLAIETLRRVQSQMLIRPDVPIRLSSADLIQFAGFFVAVRQRGTPGLDPQKRDELKTVFQWGRPDEPNCQLSWTKNLPDFNNLGADGTNIPQRCSFAGREIRVKMIERNGFTAREATVLIGAHSIGLTRNVFGETLAGPWVTNGADSATPDGPIFDNGYHKFLIERKQASTVDEFSSNRVPFDIDFPNWFRFNASSLNHLDTDVVLALRSQDTSVHPHFDTFSREFAASNTEFINSFMAAFNKMSMLGVRATLRPLRGCIAPILPAPPPIDPNFPPVSAPTQSFESEIAASIGTAEGLLAENLMKRQEEIRILTTPVNAGP